MKSKTMSVDQAHGERPMHEQPDDQDRSHLSDCIAAIFVRFFDQILDVSAKEQDGRTALDRGVLKTNAHLLRVGRRSGFEDPATARPVP